MLEVWTEKDLLNQFFGLYIAHTMNTSNAITALLLELGI
jgi:hypothetical protein